MANEILSRDENRITVLGGVTDDSDQNIVMLRVDPTTKRLLVSAIGGGLGGTVTSVSVVTANGISGSVATATTTPAITLDISALDATKIADGSITNAEFQYLNGVTSAIQTQINTKAPTDAPTFTGASNFASIVATGSIQSNTSLILEETGAGTDTITIQAPASITASYTLTLPDTDGASGEFLQTNGSGVTTWASSSFTGSFNGAQALTGVLYPRVVGSNLATGDTDLYTVPVGKRALISAFTKSMNPSAGSITAYGQIKSGGTYYRVGAAGTLTAGTGGSNTCAPTQPIVLEAGESWSVNTTTTAGLNVSFSVLEYDAICPLYSPRILALSNGNNTLYTVPAGKSAYGYNNTTQNGNAIQIAQTNTSGASRDYITYNVPSGGSAGTTNQMTASTALADNGTFGGAVAHSLATGDFIVINTNSGTAGQVVWTTVYEQTA